MCYIIRRSVQVVWTGGRHYAKMQPYPKGGLLSVLLRNSLVMYFALGRSLKQNADIMPRCSAQVTKNFASTSFAWFLKTLLRPGAASCTILLPQRVTIPFPLPISSGCPGRVVIKKKLFVWNNQKKLMVYISSFPTNRNWINFFLMITFNFFLIQINFFLIVHSLKWMITRGTPISGNHHIGYYH